MPTNNTDHTSAPPPQPPPNGDGPNGQYFGIVATTDYRGHRHAAFFPEDEVNMQSIIHLADQAMYAVKRQSKHDTKLNLLLAKDITKSTNPNAL
jgi:hypothetical protein